MLDGVILVNCAIVRDFDRVQVGRQPFHICHVVRGNWQKVVESQRGMFENYQKYFPSEISKIC